MPGFSVFCFHFHLVIYLFMTVPGLRYYAWAFSSCRERGLFPTRGVPCPGFSCCRAQAPGRAVFSGCDARASFPKVKGKVTQSCPTLCNPRDFIDHGILQASLLEWVAFSFSRGSPRPRDQTQVPCIAGRFFTS